MFHYTAFLRKKQLQKQKSRNFFRLFAKQKSVLALIVLLILSILLVLILIVLLILIVWLLYSTISIAKSQPFFEKNTVVGNVLRMVYLLLQIKTKISSKIH